jgi:alkyl sulfatase BDS1-like metallo-beta-lactamase superfamily hydrolase
LHVTVFQTLAVNLDPEAAAGVNQRVTVVFPDAGRGFVIHIRFGVAEIWATFAQRDWI